MIIYQVIISWDSYYTLDKEEAYNRYNRSGDSNKDIIEFTINPTPSLLIDLLNGTGTNLTQYSHPDILEEKHSWSLGLS